MNKIAIFMADGCEEIEGLTVVDLLRRANIIIDMLSLNDTLTVTGSHNISFKADYLLHSTDLTKYDDIVLPGGMPGTTHLAKNDAVREALHSFFNSDRLVAAICAAPTVLGQEGLLNGKHAICYPGLEDRLTGALIQTESVVQDKNIITSRGMGTAIEFGLSIIAYFNGVEASEKIRNSIVYRQEEI